MKAVFSTFTIALAAALVSTAASAADNSASMQVTASIVDECSVGNTVQLAFGPLSMVSDGRQTALDSQSVAGGTFNAICTAGTPEPQLTFTSANGAESGGFQLKGADNATLIAYAVSEVGSSGQPIAHGTPAAFTGFAADGVTHGLAIKGTILAADKAGKAKQLYTDTITITSTFGL